MYEDYSNFSEDLALKFKKVVEIKQRIDVLRKRKDFSNIQTNEENSERGTFFSNLFTSSSTNRTNSTNNLAITTEELNEFNELEKQFSALLSEECVLCGDIMVESISYPFKSPTDKFSWMIL